MQSSTTMLFRTSFKIPILFLFRLISIQQQIYISRTQHTIHEMLHLCIISTKNLVINRSGNSTIQKKLRISPNFYIPRLYPNWGNRAQTVRIATFHKIHSRNSHILYNKRITIILDITTINNLGGSIYFLFFNQINLRSFINTI